MPVAISENALLLGNVIVEPEPGPKPGVLLLLNYAHPSEFLDAEQLRSFRALIDTLIPQEE